MNNTVELKLYSSLQVELIDQGREQKDWLCKDTPVIPFSRIGSELKGPYSKWILSAIQSTLPPEEIRAAFAGSRRDWAETLSEEIQSISYSVELHGGKLYGVFTCRSEGELAPLEMSRLGRYCREHFAQGWGEGYAHCSREAPYKGLYIHFRQDPRENLLSKAGLEARHAPPWEVREVNKETFWQLLQEAKKRFGQDMGCAFQWLYGQLLMMGPWQAQNFHDVMYGYLHLANKHGLLSAASVLLDGCADDEFIDFRAWLIAQGQEVYMAALKDPDSLAKVPLYGCCRFEDLPYVGDFTYQELTGRSTYDDMDQSDFQKLREELKRDIVYGDGIDCLYEINEAIEVMPRLCAKYMSPEEPAFWTQYHDGALNTIIPQIQNAQKNMPKHRAAGKKRGEER
ncbi:DUF4240 domain-containing protein [Oscillibacter sp.]|uniref:DUF4240 domain-containing protein n=1 Tax=Oscillibacter sp. TaxID=1945593 RepID=UPI002D80FEBD|nr:DUF4240 domain-containing protein [Oscillibacter sp.]